MICKKYDNLFSRTNCNFSHFKLQSKKTLVGIDKHNKHTNKCYTAVLNVMNL